MSSSLPRIELRTTQKSAQLIATQNTSELCITQKNLEASHIHLYYAKWPKLLR